MEERSNVYMFATEAEVGLWEQVHRIIQSTLGARPEDLLSREQLGREERELPLPVPRPLLDALEMKQTVALAATPHLTRERERRVSYIPSSYSLVPAPIVDVCIYRYSYIIII